MPFAEGERSSAVAGVCTETVEGESAASTAWDKEDRVTIGGNIGGGFSGSGDVGILVGGASIGGDLGRFFDFAFGEGACGPPNPVKEPMDPDNRFEKLLFRW